MMQLNLDTTEQQALSSALKSYLSDLNYEIAATNKKDFRDELKVERDALQRIASSLDNTSE